MRVLKVTNMYPTEGRPHFGIFVRQETESLRSLGVDVDVLFIDGQASKLNYLRGYRQLWQRLREREYDLVHGHYIFGGLIARAQTRYPVVITHHGPEVFMTWEKYLCRLFTRWFDAVIVRTDEMRTRLGVKDAHIIPGGINMELFQPRDKQDCRAQLGLPPDKQLVLWAGERRGEKRYGLAAAAMSILQEHLPDAELVPLSGMPHATVPDYMNACDALVLTSESEGSPNVVKEAMACNVPVVATDVGDVRELISHTAGCYVCKMEPADIARKLQSALGFGRRTNGREAVRHLELDAVSRRIIDVYELTLSASGREYTALSPVTRGSEE